jgi:hypothetical protein
MGLLETNFAAGQLKGCVGDMVIVRYKRGVKIVRRKPVRPGERTPAEIASQKRFARANAYAKGALANPDLSAIYEEAALRLHRTAFKLAQSDWFRPPVVEKIDPSGYDGEVNGLIRINATDDFGVLRVGMVIQDLAGNTLESGWAVQEAEESPWCTVEGGWG